MEDCRGGNWLVAVQGQMVCFGEEFQNVFASPGPLPTQGCLAEGEGSWLR
ncbi:hypothetical protein AGMMS49928_01410 [Spirochaetia bacterium]|nr:hypothetical protein AGMMS49928_01410 [Spirochaetia bacterium]